MKKSFNVEGVCTARIDIELNGQIIEKVDFHSGCPGNLLGITRLVQGKEASEIIELLEGTPCGSKSTSCPDQLAKALKSLVPAPVCV